MMLDAYLQESQPWLMRWGESLKNVDKTGRNSNSVEVAMWRSGWWFGEENLFGKRRGSRRLKKKRVCFWCVAVRKAGEPIEL